MYKTCTLLYLNAFWILNLKKQALLCYRDFIIRFIISSASVLRVALNDGTLLDSNAQKISVQTIYMVLLFLFDDTFNRKIISNCIKTNINKKGLYRYKVH